MKFAGTFAAVAALLMLATGCLTDYEPLPGTRTQTQDGAGAKLYGFEAGVTGYGTTPDPYTVTQLLSFDNRSGTAPSPGSPVLIENAANDGFGAFSLDQLWIRDGHGTLNHKGITDPGSGATLHTFRRSVLCVDTAPGCQYFANVVRDNSGQAGLNAATAICFEGPAQIADTMNLMLQDANGNKIRSVDDLMGLMVRSRLNAGDTSLDLEMKKIKFDDGEVSFRKPLNIHMGNARLFNFKLDADGNREAMMQLIRHLKSKGLKTNDPVKGFTMDFGDFRMTLPDNMSISFNMKKMDEIYYKFANELRGRRAVIRGR